MADAKTYARKLMVVCLSDKANEDKKKEEESVTIDPVSIKHVTFEQFYLPTYIYNIQ